MSEDTKNGFKAIVIIVLIIAAIASVDEQTPTSSAPTESSSSSTESQTTSGKTCSWCRGSISGTGYWWNGEMCMPSDDIEEDIVEYCSSRCCRESHAKNLPRN